MRYFVSNQKAFDEDIKILPSVSDVLPLIEGYSSLEVDTETTGLDFTLDKVLLLILGTGKDQIAIDALSFKNEIIEHINPILNSQDIEKIFHNASFDYKMIRSNFGVKTEKIYDLMLAEMVIRGGNKYARFGLGNLTERYLDVILNKDVRNSFINHEEGKDFSLAQVNYALEDASYMKAIKAHQERIAAKYKLRKVVALENAAVNAFADIEYNGMIIDEKEWKVIAERNKDRIAVLEEELDKIITDNPKKFGKFIKSAFQTDLFVSDEDIRKVDIKWSSPLQVLEVMKSIFPEIESTSADDILKYKGKHEFFNKYAEYSTMKKRVSSYGYDFLDKIQSDGKIHTNFRQILNTGRVSSSGPNMQQIPSTNEYRNCFIPPKDYVFVSADYSSQELALIAWNSQDPVWLKALEEGQDLHSVAAELVFGSEWEKAAEEDCAFYEEIEKHTDDNVITTVQAKAKCSCPQHKELRTAVKSINFGLAYGMTSQALSERLLISQKEAESLIRKYFSVFPAIKNKLDWAGKFGQHKGYIRTMNPWGRIRWFPDWKGMKYTPKPILSSIERESKNTEIQGAGADMTKYAMVLVRNYIEKHNIPVMLAMTVHDQIDTYAHKDYAEQWRPKLSELMEKAALKTISSGLLKADAFISTKWEK